MGWKDWSYVKKGAVIGVIVSTAVLLALFFVSLGASGDFSWYLAVTFFPTAWLNRLVTLTLPWTLKFFLFGVISVPLYAGFGALLGKIKQMNRSTTFKGILIGGSIFLIPFVSSIIAFSLCRSHECMGAFMSLGLMPTALFLVNITSEQVPRGLESLIFVIFALPSIFIYLGIGALVGKLIDTIKQRRRIVKKGA